MTVHPLRSGDRSLTRQYEREAPFVGQLQSGWRAEARNTALPKYMRLRALAFSRARNGRHAHFREGEIGELLSIADKANVQRLIVRAVSLGLLDPLSGSRCLVVPEGMHRLSPGPALVCDRHGRKGTSRSGDDLPPSDE